MALELGNRLRFLKQSEIRNMTLECTKVGGLNLSQGICDTPVPEAVRKAAQSAIDEGYNIYTRFDGLDELRTSLAKKLERHNGLKVDPTTQLVVTNGATGAFYGACLALLDPGDEVILFEPYYGYHVDTVRAVGAVGRYVTMRPPNWEFSKDDLEAVASSRTKAIVVNSPGNPSGKVFTKAELETIRDFAGEHDCFVITDEIYEHFRYDRREHLCPATLPGLADRTITINGLSKTFSITGWRIGFSASSPKWSRTLGYINDLGYVCAPAPLQMGVARGLDVLDEDFYDALRSEYSAKRDKICGALSRAGIEPHVPQGAYYVLADMTRVPGTSSKERAMHLLEKTKVAAVPGEAFYDGNDGDLLARFCFAKTESDLDEACRRLEGAGF